MCGDGNSDPVPWSSYAPIFKAYLPEKHQNLFDLKEETLSKKPWNAVMKIYTCWIVLRKYMKEFAGFPGRDAYFGLELAEPMITPAVSLKHACTQAEYIYKQDFYLHIQQFVNRLNLPFKQQNYFIFSIAGYFMKTNECKLNGTFEIIRLCQEMREELKTRLQSSMENVPSVYKLNSKTPHLELFEKLKTLLPPHPNDLEYNSLLKLIERTDRQKCVKKNTEFYERMLDHIRLLIEILEVFIQNNPHVFLPRPQNPENHIPTVRLFTGRDYTYVMVHELIKEMKDAKMNTTEVEGLYGKKPELWTISEWSARIALRDSTNGANFISMPSTFGKSRAIPVPFYNGKYCVSTPDVLSEILMEMIVVHGHLHGLNRNHWTLFEKLFKELEQRLWKDSEGARFIADEKAMTVKKWFLSVVEERLKQFPRKMQEVKFVKGFTLKQLKEEMIRLGLTESFDRGEIMKHSEILFSTAKQQKSVLDTGDMHTILNTIQMELILSKLPIISKTFHDYRACGGSLRFCPFCGFGKSSENSVPVVDSDEKKAEKRREKKKRQSEKRKMANESLKDIPEDVEQKASTSESVSLEKKCENCFRNSQACEATKEKLRDVKNKNKGLKKEAEEVKNRNMEKDEKIRLLEEILNLVPTPILEDVAPKIKVSEKKKTPNSTNCAKCFRTNQFHEEEKEKLKEEKIRTKTLRKEIEEWKTKEIGMEERIQQLEQELADLDSFSSFQIPPSPLPIRKKSNFSPETSAKLYELFKIRQSIPSDRDEKIEKAQKLLGMANDETDRKLARNEWNMILIAYRNYQKEVNRSIEWIQNNKDKSILQMPPLPESPKFSKSFEQVYDRIVNGELADQECVVCLEEMTDQKNTVKCRHCRRRFHYQCVMEYVKTGNNDKCLICRKKTQFD